MKTNCSLKNANRLLLEAASQGDLAGIRKVINNGADINIGDDQEDERNTALMKATLRGDMDCVKLLISKGADLHITSDHVVTALIMALAHGHRQIAMYLKLRGAKLIDDKEANIHFSHSPALGYAAEHGALELAKELIKNGVHPEAGYPDYPALVIAAEHNHPEFVKLLVEQGVDVNAFNIHNETALTHAVGLNDLNLASMLIEHGAKFNPYESHLLASAIHCKHFEMANILIDNGVRFDVPNHSPKLRL